MSPSSPQRYPEPTVGALIVNDSGEILLVQSYKWNNFWSVPGGHIELGERAEEAVKREVKEEVGLDVEPVKMLMVQQAVYPKNFMAPRHFIFMDFLCRTKSSKVKLDEREIQESKWATPEEALQEKLEEFTRNLVEKYLSEKNA
ncbi:MAG: NUDIX domain-containing protein [Thaumarchaeota archaeon]|nr:NUDIX domain-containing protein [Nitrososphaerota archaeon]MCL5317596.1 NUDIX domain-containing protein [Nitrososphaerota archaeon]